MSNRLLMKILYNSQNPLDHKAHPVASLLLSENDKDALRLVAKELRKRPDHLLLQALHVYALLRLRRSDQALDALDVLAASPALHADQNILHLVSTLYFACGLPDKASALYDLVQSSNPDSYPYAVAACIFSLRSCDTTRMSQYSRRLFKIAEKKLPRSLWWCILAHIIQASSSSQSPQHYALALSVADRYAKHPDAQPQTSHEFYVIAKLRYLQTISHLDLCTLDLFPFRTAPPSQRSKHISIITETGPQLLDKFPEDEQARKTLFEYISSQNATDAYARDLGLELWKRHIYLNLGTMSDWKSCFDEYLQLVNNGDRNWATIGTLTRLAVKLQKNSESKGSDTDEQVVQFAKTAVSSLIDSFSTLLAAKGEKQSTDDRGIVLGLVDLATYAAEKHILPETDIIKYLEQYIDAYTERTFCWSDVHPYIANLSSSNIDSLRGIVASKMANIKETSGKSAGYIDPFITLTKIQHALKKEDSISIEDNVQEAQNFASRYYLFQNKQDPTESDLQSADEYATLSAQTYILAWSKSKDTIHLYRAAALLQIAITDYDERFFLKLLLIRILRLLCAPAMTTSMWDSLAVKSIQHDTLSHYVLDRSCIFATQESNLDGFENVITYYHMGVEEASDSTLDLWNADSYSQMEDFLDLSNKLNWSLWRAIAHFDFFLLLNTLTLQDSSARSDSKFIVRMLTMFMAKCESDDISDNRDYDVLPNLASLEGSTLYDMTSFGPRRGKKWFLDFAKSYIRILDPTQWKEGEVLSSEENTESEKKLLEFMYNLAGLFQCASKGEVGDSHREKLQAYFTEEQAKITVLKDKPDAVSEVTQSAKHVYEACSFVKRAMRDHLASEESANNNNHANNSNNSNSTKPLISSYKVRTELLKWFKNKLVKEHAKVTLDQISKCIKQFSTSSPSQAAEKISNVLLENESCFPESKAHATKTLITKIMIDQAAFIKNTYTALQKAAL